MKETKEFYNAKDFHDQLEQECCNLPALVIVINDLMKRIDRLERNATKINKETNTDL